MLEKKTDWLANTRHIVRRLHDEIAAADMSEIRDLLRRTLTAIDPPRDVGHRAVLSVMAIDVCRHIVGVFHDANGGTRCDCHRVAWLQIETLTNGCETDPRLALRTWTEAFLGHFEREHPRTSASLAAAAIRAEPTRSWTLEDLGREVGARPIHLREEFLAHFGLRPSTYVHLVRVAKAVGLFRTTAKVEAIAWEVGYRSKKDLYAALRRWIDATPTELRALSDDEREWLERQLRVRCVRRTVDAHESEDTAGSRQRRRRHRRAPRPQA